MARQVLGGRATRTDFASGNEVTMQDFFLDGLTIENIVTIPDKEHTPVGKKSLMELFIPAGKTALRAAWTRNSWANPGGEVIQMTVEISFDNGVTWPYKNTFGSRGGTGTKEDGNLTHSETYMPLPDSGSTTRKGRVFMDNNIQLNTGLTVEVA